MCVSEDLTCPGEASAVDRGNKMDILITMACTALMTFVMVKVTEIVPSDDKRKKTLQNSIAYAEAMAVFQLPSLSAYSLGWLPVCIVVYAAVRLLPRKSN